MATIALAKFTYTVTFTPEIQCMDCYDGNKFLGSIYQDYDGRFTAYLGFNTTVVVGTLHECLQAMEDNRRLNVG